MARTATPPLTETAREQKRVLEAFALPEGAGLVKNEATAAAVRAKLASVRYAHLATHGFFDQEALKEERRRAALARKRWELNPRGTAEVGLGARNPLGFVGLALAGANEAGKGGILTGLDVLELPLNKMRLCVLSACETGLGDLDDLEGVQGLQRAFHVAGCANVIGSLWQVNDAATAALMAQFYHELRVNKRSPLEALREAQLTIYRHPARIPDLAGERGRPARDKAVKLGARPTGVPAAGGRKTEPRLWAAFVLSGTGR